jgi:hypothetical protein
VSNVIELTVIEELFARKTAWEYFVFFWIDADRTPLNRRFDV